MGLTERTVFVRVTGRLSKDLPGEDGTSHSRSEVRESCEHLHNSRSNVSKYVRTGEDGERAYGPSCN